MTTIKIGDKIPDVSLKRLGPEGMEEISTGDYFSGRKVVLFAVPGAFTPTCAQKHLPGYIKEADNIKANGVDEIVCMAVNDPFVMKHWADVAHTDGKITMMPDGNGDFTRALGLGMDGSGVGLGFRAKRFSMLIDDGVIRDLQVEPEAGEVDLSGAAACLARLRS